MRLTINLCHKRGCTRMTRPGVRFCYHKDCGKDEEGDEEE